MTVVDADPNHTIAACVKGAALSANLSILAEVDKDSIIDRIEYAGAETPFVVVDLQGTAAKIVLLSVIQADLVVIPMQGSQLDAERASRAIRALKQHEKMTGRAWPCGLLLTRTSPIIRTRTMGPFQGGLLEAGVPYSPPSSTSARPSALCSSFSKRSKTSTHARSQTSTRHRRMLSSLPPR